MSCSAARSPAADADQCRCRASRISCSLVVAMRSTPTRSRCAMPRPTRCPDGEGAETVDRIADGESELCHHHSPGALSPKWLSLMISLVRRTHLCQQRLAPASIASGGCWWTDLNLSNGTAASQTTPRWHRHGQRFYAGLSESLG